MRSPELLTRHDSRLLIVDMQAKLLPHIHDHEAVLKKCAMLVEAAQLLGLPAFATEQYPQGLGQTVEPLATLIPSRPSKLRFSAADCLGWGLCSPQESRYRVVLAGIEAHICVLQTAFDLLAAGFQVFVVADATSSRSPRDHEWALRRLASGGATVTTAEAVLFEWCESAEAPEFKRISQLVKQK